MRRFLQYESRGGGITDPAGGGKSGCGISEDITPTLACTHGGEPVVAMATQQGGAEIMENKSPTITASAGESGNNQPCIALDRAAYNQGQNAQYDIGIAEDGKAQTVVAKGLGAVAYNGDKASTIDAHYGVGCGMRSGKERDLLAQEQEGEYIVRRLTPKECGRLQGMPDWWVDFEHKDAPEYKMWGNGVALPCAMYIFEGFAKEGK